MIKTIILPIFMGITLSTAAQAPEGYYDSCEGKCGQALLSQLYNTVSSHTNVGYDGLWEVYKTSDVRPDGTLWDIYSTKQWPADGFTKCGNYSIVGDCVNREHSFPKSWWGGGKAAQYSDAFHLYPTDGKVNGQRSSYPYGECAGGSTLPSSGYVRPLGRVGTSTFAGYTGKVFEPDDEYKGDLARSYFYMAAAYNNLIASWNSDMLSGNTYPVFSTWATNLLLKWCLQDEVSQKETDRNNAIYAHQHNRNPFIDHPEMAEHIWGDKKNVPWHSTSTSPILTRPSAMSIIDLGYTSVGRAASKAIEVKGSSLTEALRVSVNGAGLTVSPTTLTAAAVNAGTTVTITATSASEGTIEGSLTLSSPQVTRTVDVTAEVVEGLPLYNPTSITENTFTIRWVNIGHTQTYTLHVMHQGTDIDGYPKAINAADETYTVTALTPGTTYSIRLDAQDITSRTISVTTATPQPDVYVYFDGILHFSAIQGSTSEIAELLFEAENIDSDITFAIDAPFQLSSDRQNWSDEITLNPQADHFYMRLNSNETGQFESTLAIYSTDGSYNADNITVTGTVTNAATSSDQWIETFDMYYPSGSIPDAVRCYSSTTFDGTAWQWAISNAGIGNSSTDRALTGTDCIRFGKNADSWLAMNRDMDSGIGTLTFTAAKWGSDANATIQIETSTDQGATWTTAGTVTLTSNAATPISIDINQPKPSRMRLRQTAGARWLADDIALTSYNAITAVNALPYHRWDAYCLDGALVIDSRDTTLPFAVYSTDGNTLYTGTLPSGTHTLQLQPGIYLVTAQSHCRRVLVR